MSQFCHPPIPISVLQSEAEAGFHRGQKIEAGHYSFSKAIGSQVEPLEWISDTLRRQAPGAKGLHIGNTGSWKRGQHTAKLEYESFIA